MWTAPPLVGRATGRPASRRQPPFQCEEKVVPNWQTLRGAAAVAVTTMRASVGCIPNNTPEGFSRKSLRTTSETSARAAGSAVTCARDGGVANTSDHYAMSVLEGPSRLVFRG